MKNRKQVTKMLSNKEEGKLKKGMTYLVVLYG